jgi:glycosyltransferase involved in cell wall biosynthesis
MVAGTFPANHALQVARGDYITHLDDDDEFLPERIAKLVDWARDKNADLVWHPFLWEDNTGQWLVNPAVKLAVNQVTTSSIFYRHWFKNIPWDPLAHLLDEPGDWNLIRKIKALGAVCVRHPEALLRHYREQSRLLPNKAA